MSAPIRLKIKSKTCEGNVCYIVVRNRRVDCFSRKLTRHPLSSMTDDAAELKFALEDATDSQVAITAVNKFVKNKEVTAI